MAGKHTGYRFGIIFVQIKRMKRGLIFITILWMISSICMGQQKPSKINNGIDRPKLVVGLVIDQMRWDYLFRYADSYGTGGFKRLLKQGFSFENTIIPYTPTVTAAGHACLYTGSVPAVHGIVGNDWIERDGEKSMYCAQDKSVNSVGTASKQGQMSPRNMLSNTIGDELRLASNFNSRVYGIALKDRGGIMPAGHSANAAYWFDDSTGHWISSSYYMNNLPSWVSEYNDQKKPDSFMKIDWNLLYPQSTYHQSTTDDKAYEKPLNHEKQKTFPHIYSTQIGKGYFPIRQSPYGNTITFDFAKQLIQQEKLGASGQTDMICISLSSTDYVGHRFGPNSMELEDMYLRVDLELAQFLQYLDKTVGENNYLFFLSADHGAPQVPDFMKENKIPAGNLRNPQLMKELNAACAGKYKDSLLVKGIFEYTIYLNMPRIDSLQLDVNAIKNTVLSYLKSKPEVMYAFDYAAFDKAILPANIKERFANGYFYKRSGDIQYILKPQYTDVLSTGTEHGTWYNYDAHIPLLWYGWKIKPGKSNREVYMTDVAPTIAAMLKIQMPNGSVGKVLLEILQ